MSQTSGGSETDANSKPVKLSHCLHSAFETTIEKFSSSVKFSYFKKKYRAIYEVDPDGLKSYFDQLKEQLCKNVHEDLKNSSTNYGIQNLLQSLQKINENKSSISWRPSGNPEEDVRDHLYAYKVQHRDKLKNYLSSLQTDNEEISTEVAVNHSEILHIKEKNKEMYQKFSSITELYAGRNLQKFDVKAAECFAVLKLARDKATKHKNTEPPKSATKKSRVVDTNAIALS